MWDLILSHTVTLRPVGPEGDIEIFREACEDDSWWLLGGGAGPAGAPLQGNGPSSSHEHSGAGDSGGFLGPTGVPWGSSLEEGVAGCHPGDQLCPARLGCLPAAGIPLHRRQQGPD